MALGADIGQEGLRTKGKFGALLECALGASMSTGRERDFPGLSVELKSIPIREDGTPLESTYVCTLHVETADELAWESSWVRAKLSSVLWVAVLATDEDWQKRPIKQVHHWTPSPEQEAVLRADFEECVGLVTTGNVEALSGRVGTALQVRPKARDGAKTARVRNDDGDWAHTVPKGFYLRPSFTAQILARAGK
jgi:DNA mismatch repair protein MutH